MSLAKVSVQRPTFITCIVLVMLAVGLLFMSSMGVDLFPDVTFPVVTVTTTYPGAGPAEVETLVTKPIEDEVTTLSGLKRITSVNSEGISQVIAEFTLETDIKFAEQQIRDRVGSAKPKLPQDVKESIIRRIDPSDQPIVILSITGDLPDSKMFDVADDIVRPKLEQVSQVGQVLISGGRKREIQIQLDKDKLRNRELSVTSIANRIGMTGENIPNGTVDQGKKQTVFRTLGEFHSVDEIRKSVISFFGNDYPTIIDDVGKVVDTVEDETTRAFFNGKKSMFLQVYRQSGSNTIAVVDALMKRIESINMELQRQEGKPKLSVIRDGSLPIRANVDDVKESIYIGILLAVVVVFFFLGSGRSTIITGLALPNSLIGAFILMGVAGFTINLMTLLALSLSVGLLIDDAIVVRENIFRHMEMGKSPRQAALEGTAEVSLAVIATTLAVIAVFGPVAFLKGIVGQFFKQFGFTICFAMAISLFDALTIAPMLSTYFAGNPHAQATTFLGKFWEATLGRATKSFDRFQTLLENHYEKIIRYTTIHPLKVLFLSTFVALGACSTIKYVPKTFLPAQDAGEFSVSLDLPPGTNLDGMNEVAFQVNDLIQKQAEVELVSLTVGGKNNEPEKAELYVKLVPSQKRKMNTSEVKASLRKMLTPFAHANPKVKDFDAIGGGQRPFNVNIIGLDQKELERIGTQAFEIIRKHPGLLDADTNFRLGKPEFQIALDPVRSKGLGISSKAIGNELRGQVQGLTPAKFRVLGREYDIRVRLQDNQRDLKASFYQTYVPNMNNKLIRLADVASPHDELGPATINRQDRGRMISISGDIVPTVGMAKVMADVSRILEEEVKLPLGMRYMFVGQAENFKELGESMMLAMGFGILFIFLVLASLYESFVTPLTIMVALPLALCGSFTALCIGRESLNIFSMIGSIMLLGVATKNSILMVDYTNQLIAEGLDRSAALIRAGKTRLRPILMTTMALIAGTIPIALGLNEASRQRTSMGVAIIGGLITSTLLTLIVVPAVFSFIDRFRIWSKARIAGLVGANISE